MTNQVDKLLGKDEYVSNQTPPFVIDQTRLDAFMSLVRRQTDAAERMLNAAEITATNSAWPRRTFWATVVIGAAIAAAVVIGFLIRIGQGVAS